MSKQSEEFLAILFRRTWNKRTSSPITKNNGDPCSFKGYSVDLVEVDVPVDFEGGERYAEDAVVG